MRLNTSVGDIELRGRLPGCTRFATGTPSTEGTGLKSVSSLFSRKPLVMWYEPSPDSMVVVIDTTLPYLSCSDRWVVPRSCTDDGDSGTSPRSPAATGVVSTPVVLIRLARWLR
ncbi:hypothetical protein D3C81_1657460 [compost metagenome]